MSNGVDRDDAHLQDVEDGCGCAEVWEALSEHRSEREDADGGDVASAEEAGDVDEGPVADATVPDGAVAED
jgi:hypothetical protein